MSELRDWTILLVGGASGVGKSSVSYRLAHHYGVGITEVDDFQVILEGMTTPDQYPVLHVFRTQPEAWGQMNDEQLLAHAIEYANVIARALELVIANHLDSGVPIILEGDFVLPSLAVQGSYCGVPAAGQVQALFLFEDDEVQIGRNLAAREGQPQPKRARASWHYGEWLRAEAERLGVPTIAARPWTTVFERATAVIESAAHSLVHPPISPSLAASGVSPSQPTRQLSRSLNRGSTTKHSRMRIAHVLR